MLERPIRGGGDPRRPSRRAFRALFLAEFLAVAAALDRRWPETAMEPSTERIAALADALGEPQRTYPVVGPHRHRLAHVIDALPREEKKTFF